MGVTEKLKAIAEVSASNFAFFAYIWAALTEMLPTTVTIIGGISLAWYNIEKALTIRAKRRQYEKDQESDTTL